jgi:ABC-type transporter Mla subunit MlaD
MSNPIRISMQTRKNWLIDAAVFVGGIVAALSGIYFLFLPSGGYQGGRNPTYGITFLFDR